MNSKDGTFEKQKRIRYQLKVADEDYEKHSNKLEGLKEAQQDYQMGINQGKRLLDELEYYWQGDEAQHFIFQIKDELFQEEREINERFYDRHDEMEREKRRLQGCVQKLENDYRKATRED